MAINILTEPTDPPIAGDFTLDQAIQHAAETPQLSILTTWESTGAAPAAKQGAFIRHAGNTFQVQSSDEAISGSVTAGLNYIIATETAGVITLAWATTLTGYSYNPAYGGIYDSSGKHALRDVCYLDGASYTRGLAIGNDLNNISLANGNISLANGIINFRYPLMTHGRPVIASQAGAGDEQGYFNLFSPLMEIGVETFCTGTVVQFGQTRAAISMTLIDANTIEVKTGTVPVFKFRGGNSTIVTASISL